MGQQVQRLPVQGNGLRPRVKRASARRGPQRVVQRPLPLLGLSPVMGQHRGVLVA
jgi:hypothetical protein